jgi:hypothetical protein
MRRPCLEVARIAYHIDDAGVTLADLRRRIETTDLVPSRACLVDGIDSAMSALGAHGVSTLAELRDSLRTKKRLDSVARSTGLDTKYLTLLRREIESYFPKPAALSAFDWLPPGDIAGLESRGVADTAAFFARAGDHRSREALADSTGASLDTLDSLARYSDLCRVQWVSPTTARWLVEAGCESAADLAACDVDELGDALTRVNRDNRLVKGRVGLRDVGRLIRSAGYVAG